LGEWYEFLIFPVFSIACIYLIGKNFGIWDKLGTLWNQHGGRGRRLNFHSIATGLKGVKFEGVAKFFRKD
jgi:hypothetical protein